MVPHRRSGRACGGGTPSATAARACKIDLRRDAGAGRVARLASGRRTRADREMGSGWTLTARAPDDQRNNYTGTGRQRWADRHR